MKHKNKTQKYWYRFTFGECPVCGRDQSYKERVYSEKPENTKDRYVYLSNRQSYCGCMY